MRSGNPFVVFSHFPPPPDPRRDFFFFKKDVFLPGRWNPEVSVGVGSSEALLGLGQSPREGQTPRPLPLPGQTSPLCSRSLEGVCWSGTPAFPQVALLTQDKGGERGRQISASVDVCVCFPWVVSAGELAPRSWLGLETVPYTSHKGSPIHKHSNELVHPAHLSSQESSPAISSVLRLHQNWETQ